MTKSLHRYFVSPGNEHPKKLYTSSSYRKLADINFVISYSFALCHLLAYLFLPNVIYRNHFFYTNFRLRTTEQLKKLDTYCLCTAISVAL